MSSADVTSACQTRACTKPAAGIGPIACLNLCFEHLKLDIEKVNKEKCSLIDRLSLVRESSERQHLLTTKLQRLTDQREKIFHTFDALEVKLQQWRDLASSRVQEAYESVAGRLSDATEAEQCEKDIALTFKAGDMRKVTEQTVSIGLWLDEAIERQTAFRQMKSIGDLAAGVEKLHHLIDTHMDGLMHEVHVRHPLQQPKQPMVNKNLTEATSQSHLEVPIATPTAPEVCRPLATIGELQRNPYYVTVCANTTGYASDPSNRVVRADASVAGQSALPQTCLFVSFEPESVDYLLVTRLDGEASRLRFKCDLDWNKWINGLHCDSGRQRLFLIQHNVVTVTDLCGRIERVINATSLRQSVDWIGSAAASDNQLFLLEMEQHKVFIVSKDSGNLDSIVSLSSLNSGGEHRRITALGLIGSSMLLLVESTKGHVYKTDLSGRLLASLTGLAYPWMATSDSGAQFVFVSEFSGHTVQVLTGDGGATLQTIGTPGRMGSDDGMLHSPMGLAVASDVTGAKFLVIADSKNCRLRVYEVT